MFNVIWPLELLMINLLVLIKNLDALVKVLLRVIFDLDGIVLMV